MVDALRRWLNALHIDDPAERRLALLLQLLLVGMLAAVSLAIVLNVVVFGLSALSPAGLLPNLTLLLVIAGALVPLRRGRFRLSASIVVGALLVGQSYALLSAGLAFSPGQLLVFVIPITLAGLVLGQRALAATAALSLLITLAAASVPAEAPPEQLPVGGLLVLFAIVIGVFSLMLDRFTGALREALGESSALAAENARLLREAHQQRAELGATLTSIGDAVIATDAAGRVSFINPVAARLTGWPQAQALGRHLDEVFVIVNEQTRRPVESPVARVLREGSVVGLANHTVLLARDGRPIPIDDSGAPIHDAQGRLSGVILVFQDITERRQAELDLRESEARFRAMADSAPVLIWVSDLSRGFTFFNQPWLSFTGRSLQQELGLGWAAGVHPDDREGCLRTYGASFDARSPFSLDYRLRRADGEYRWVLGTGVPRFAPDGGFAGFIGSCVDITERHIDERYLRTQNMVAQILAEATSAGGILEQVLAAVGVSLGWEWGAMWDLDQAMGVLRCAEHWASPNLAGEPLSRASSALTLGPGQGLPGQAWARSAPIAIEDLTDDSSFLRAEAVRALGLRGAVAVPIFVGGAFVGAIEFFRRERYSSDQRLLEAMAAIAAQVGQFLERVETLEALRASEERHRTLVDANPQLTWVLTPTGSVNYFNRRWGEYTGLGDDAREGMRWVEACHPDDRAAMIERRSAAIKAGEAYEQTVRLRRADGAYRWHLVRVVPLREAGRVMAWFGTAADINELKTAEDAQRFLTEATTALAASLAYESTLARVADLAVPDLADWCIVDLRQEDGSVATVAQAHRDPTKQAIAEELARRYPPAQGAPSGPARVIRTGAAELAPTLTRRDLAALASDREHALLLESLGMRSYLCVPILLDGRAFGSIALVANQAGRYGPDDLRLAEELARRAALAIENARLYGEAQEAIAVRDQFLSIASHELKTPLTALLGYAQLLHRRHQHGHGLPERDRRALRTIVAQGERLERLVNLLLDLSRIELGQLKIERAQIDLAALVREAVEDLQPALERHRLVLEGPQTPLLIDGDALRLDQVVQNLLQNAVKYSPNGGTIRVRLDRRDGELLLAVSDEGIGIPSAALPNLFGRFYRAPNVAPLQISGTGIGLYVVREIVAHHGGTIGVESVEGAGTTFTVCLPLAITRIQTVGAS